MNKSNQKYWIKNMAWDTPNRELWMKHIESWKKFEFEKIEWNTKQTNLTDVFWKRIWKYFKRGIHPTWKWFFFSKNWISRNKFLIRQNIFETWQSFRNTFFLNALKPRLYISNFQRLIIKLIIIIIIIWYFIFLNVFFSMVLFNFSFLL